MSSHYEAFLEKEHFDTKYFKQDEIGLILSKGLSETYRLKPQKPIEYFSKWLLNYASAQKKSKDLKDRQITVSDMKMKYSYSLKQKDIEV